MLMAMHSRLLLAALVFFGCKSRDEASSAARPPDLHIVSAGAEPRQHVRYQPAKGTKQELEIALDVDVTAGEMGGPIPTIAITLSLVVEDVLPTGGIELRSTVTDAQARDRDESRAVAKALGGPLDLMKGIAITTTMTPAGRLVGTKVDTAGKQLPDSAKTQLAALSASFDQLMMPLPEVPIGIGAVWRSSKNLEQNGMKMTAVNSVELVSVGNATLAYEIDTQVHGADQTVSQGGLTVDIKDITGTGGGKGAIDLKTLSITSELWTELRSSMQSPGEDQPTAMKMSIARRVMPVLAAPAPPPAAPAPPDAQGAQSAP
jgi:hypothetical protein